MPEPASPLIVTLTDTGARGARLQFVRRAVGDDLSLVDDDGARAGGLDFLEDVGRKDDRLVRAHPFDQSADLVLLIGVESVGRFIEDEDFRIVNDGLGEAGAVTITFRQGVDALSAHPSRKQVSIARLTASVFARPAHPAQFGGEIAETPRPSCPNRAARSPGDSRLLLGFDGISTISTPPMVTVPRWAGDSR